MSGNGELIGGNGELEKKEHPKELVLTIKMSQEGGLTVEAPGNGKMYDEPMCFYLLEKAKDFIKGANQRVVMQNKPQIVKPSVMDFARRFKR